MKRNPLNCPASGCADPARTLGLCGKHYSRARRAGELPGQGPCAEESCDAKAYARGLCSQHYQLFRARDKGVTPRKPANTVSPWRLNGKGYVARRVYVGPKEYRQELQHRVVMEGVIGRPLETHEDVHHLNGVRDDNRAENLELWSRKHPKGQRVIDKLAYAREIIALYEPLEGRGLV